MRGGWQWYLWRGQDEGGRRRNGGPGGGNLRVRVRWGGDGGGQWEGAWMIDGGRKADVNEGRDEEEKTRRGGKWSDAQRSAEMKDGCMGGGRLEVVGQSWRPGWVGDRWRWSWKGTGRREFGGLWEHFTEKGEEDERGTWGKKKPKDGEQCQGCSRNVEVNRRSNSWRDKEMDVSRCWEKRNNLQDTMEGKMRDKQVSVPQFGSGKLESSWRKLNQQF